jgi:hypothetical protein
MIEDPWIILMTDRRRLGSPLYAVARARPGGKAGPIRRTMRVERALRFPTRRKASFTARRLMQATCGLLFTVLKIDDGDFRRPRPASEIPATPLTMFE